MRKINTVTGPIQAKIKIPGSKSITQRALHLAALADGVSELTNVRINAETKNFIKALHQLGIVVQLDETTNSCIIAGGKGQFPRKQASIKCGNSKTVAYFLITACAASLGVYYFDGSKTLRQLPLHNFIHLLCRKGAQLIPSDIEHMPFTLVGADTFEGGDLIIESDATDQFASALLMISPYARSAFNFNVVNLVNPAQLDMTCAMMAEFGVLVHRIHHGNFMIPVPQHYHSRNYVIEPDFSLAAYFFAAAALTKGEVSIQATKRALSKQPEIKFLSVLEKMGCKVEETANALTVKGMDVLKGVDISMRDFENCLPMLATLAPFASSPTRITHIGSNKNFKRIQLIKNQLLKMNIRVETSDDWIKIYPGKPESMQISTFNDPQIAMAFSLMGLKVPEITIENSHCVEKIFPEFFNLWDELAEHPYEQISAAVTI